MSIEVCCGAGGLALGFKRAGINFDFAFDSSPEAVNSYEANLQRCPIQIDVKRDLLRLARVRAFKPSVDLFVADPPCSPWSTAGARKGLSDPRDLLLETCELIALLMPQTFLIGNIPGLDLEPNQKIVADTIGRFAKFGYCISDFIVLNAADYGVPQFRARPFWFGHQRGPCIRWPEPTHHDPARGLSLFGTSRPWITCREALEHLPLKELGQRAKINTHPRRGGPKMQRRQSKKNETAQLTEHPSGHCHPISKLDRPAYTITTREGRGASVLAWPGMKGANAIILSEKAALILQGFPPDWKLIAKTKRARWSMIGQALPPPLAEAIGRSILDQRQRTESAA